MKTLFTIENIIKIVALSIIVPLLITVIYYGVILGQFENGLSY